MLTRNELKEMRVLAQRATKGQASREDWANLAGLTLIFQGDAIAVAIAAQGLDTFIATAAPQYEPHHFQHDDFKRIYARVCEAAARYHRDRVH